LQTLINNLLDSSSIEAGQFTLYRQPTDLGEVLQEALRMAGPLLERRRQHIRLEESVPVPLFSADPTRLIQVIVNLLVNASKYSPPEQAIDVRIVRQDGMVRVSVADRGSGIPPAERENIFRRFVRRQVPDGKQYGIGLGLFVVRTVVEAHGGCVGVGDRPGGGSVFWFDLPLIWEEEG
jgi:signal transduction histidine kinase